ncbi:hypothetical protein [Roseicyclus sp.]|uniref:hypothetical protein n=1 Tax=Roseicyclus sp. TaxID=1914329 RepID=UPI003FA12BCB
MNDRRVATLKLLARIERDGLQDVVRKHALVQKGIEDRRAEASALAGRIETETSTISAETAPYVGAFISAVRAEIGRYDTERRILEREAETLADDVRDRFRRTKTAELAAAKEMRAVLARRQGAEDRERLDDMLLRGQDGPVS